MISSVQNPKIKRIRLLQSQSRSRKKELAFVVEGIRLLEEALNTFQIPELVIYTSDLDPRSQNLVEAFLKQNVPCEEVTEEVIKAASDTETPQGILAILPLKPLLLPAEADFLMIADEIRDPGNLGTLLRTAQAAGAGNGGSLLSQGDSSGNGRPFPASDIKLQLGKDPPGHGWTDYLRSGHGGGFPDLGR